MASAKCSFIKMVAYELYKQDWLNKHISPVILLNSKRDYYTYRADCNEGEELLYEEWIKDVGFNGESYVCFDEFCQEEYLSVGYIEELLSDKNLISLYQKDLRSFRMCLD